MRKTIAFIILAVSLYACGSKKNVAEIRLGTEKTIAYQSLGNGVAAISLTLYKNNTFKLHFKSIPQPETNEKPVKHSEIGTYIGEGDWKTLQFVTNDFDAYALFDPQYSNPDEIKVLNENTVKINTAKQTLNIWGVLCERE